MNRPFVNALFRGFGIFAGIINYIQADYITSAICFTLVILDVVLIALYGSKRWYYQEIY